MTVAAVLTAIASVQAGIAGIVRAYDGNVLPDSVEDMPSFVSFPFFPARGTFEYRPGSSEVFTYPVTMRLFLSKVDLKDASQQAIGLIEPIRAAFRANVRLGNTVQWCRIESIQLGEMTYAGESTFGIDLVLMVQQIEPVTPTA